MISKGGFHSTLARLERSATCIRGSRYWCSASMLSYCMTVCQPLTARIDDHTHFFIFCSIVCFRIIFTAGKNNNLLRLNFLTAFQFDIFIYWCCTVLAKSLIFKAILSTEYCAFWLWLILKADWLN